MDHLVDIIVQAVEHKGFAFIDVLQPCVSFNNTYQKYNQLVEILDRIPGSYEEAMAVARKKDKLPIGILYRVEEPVYHKALYGDWNPITKRLSQKDRRERIAKLFQPK